MPFIVFDANIESAVNGSIAGIFGASGQAVSPDRGCICTNSIADEFLQRRLEVTTTIALVIR